MGPMSELIPSVFALEPLIESALRSTALIAIAAIVALATTRASASIRHLVWTLALVGCVAMPVASRLVPGWSLPALPAWERRTETAPEPATLVEPATGKVPDRAQVGTATEPASVASTTHPTGVTRTARSWRPDIADARRLAPLLWLAGVLLLAARHAFGWASLARIARRSTPMVSREWETALARHGVTLGLRRLPAIGVSPRIAVPIVCGIRRPTILVPGEALEWPAGRRDAVLLHELAHVRRFDLLTTRLALLVSTLYWFNPFVWLAARRQRAEAERACDDQVLDAGGRASTYASDLLEIARAGTARGHLDAAALAMARRSQLEGRLFAILDPAQARGRAGRIATSLAVLIAVGSIGVLAAARPAQSRRAAEADAPSVSQEVARQAEAAPPTTSETSPEPESAATRSLRETAAPPASAAAPPAPAAAPTDASSPASDSKLIVPLLAAGSSKGSANGKGSSHWSIIDAGDGEVRSGTWTHRDRRGSFRSKGSIRYSRELDDIESISPGGYVEVEDRRDGRAHRAAFKGRPGGVERSYSVDGDEHAWDDAARAWLADFLVELDHGSGMLVEQRFPRLMSEGGPSRVLREVTEMSSDYGRGIYLRKLLDTGLDDPTMRRVVAQAGREIASDYELAQALIAAAGKNALDNAETGAAYLEAVGSLQSDYEHGRTLKALIGRRDLSPALVDGIVQSASGMQSDYERAEVMITLAAKGHVKPARQGGFLRGTHTFSSDYERGRVLRALIAHGLAGESFDDLLLASAKFQSDYERANVFVELAESVQMSASQRAAFVEATKAFSSDYERGRSLSALGSH